MVSAISQDYFSHFQSKIPFSFLSILFPAAVNMIFSFTNGADWDGPYRIQFQVPRAWRNKPMDFFNEVYALKHSNSI